MKTPVNPENLVKVQNEFHEKTKGQTYQSFIEADSPH